MNSLMHAAKGFEMNNHMKKAENNGDCRNEPLQWLTYEQVSKAIRRSGA